MKITHCIVSSNNNPFYYDFYPIIKKIWEEYMNIKVIYIYVGDFIPNELEIYKDDIILFKPLKGISTIFTTEIIRLFYPAFLDPENTYIISDMDMMPIRKSYYIDSIVNIPDDKFVHMRTGCYRDENRYIMCYNIGKGEVFAKIFKNNDTLENLIIKTYKKCIYDNNNINTYDEFFLYNKLQEWNNLTNNCIFFTDTNLNHNMLDRVSPDIYYLDTEKKNNIINGKYNEYHMLRPYKGKEKNHIDEVVSLIFNKIIIEPDVKLSYLKILKSIFRFTTDLNAIEFGGNEFSTRILVENCIFLSSYEQSEENYNKIDKLFFDYKNWNHKLKNDIEYPSKIDLCFINTDLYIDNKIVNEMLDKKVPIIIISNINNYYNNNIRENELNYCYCCYKGTCKIISSRFDLVNFLSKDLL